MSKQKTHREPLVYITRRSDVSLKTSILTRVIAVAVALVLCAVVTKVLTGANPLKLYQAIFVGAFGTFNAFLDTLHEIALLLCVALAITPAFKMKFWNIGAEGQALVGALATAACMFYLGGKMPDALLIVVMALCAVLAGMVWAVIPAFFKAFWNTNETLFTLMMNYVAIQLVQFFLKIADKSGSNTVGPSLLKNGWFPKVFGQNYILNVFIVAVLTAVMYIYLSRSKQGYEISVVGESENTARYIGINVKKVILRTMLISGAICGLCGLLIVGGASHSIDANLIKGRGFTAIMVSWLAKFNPIVMIFASALWVFFNRGARELSAKFGLNGDFSEILIGIVLFFIIGCEFFIRYRVHFNLRKKKNATKGEA